MAKELGCKNSSIYHHWENGKYTPPFAVIKQLFEMGATVEELFGVLYKGTSEPDAEFKEKVIAVLNEVSNSGTIQIGVKNV